MRIKLLIATISVIFSSVGSAQQNLPSNNLLLGYQRFPTIITGHAADSDGNQYYVGSFKGELTINDKAIATGHGLDDIFWVKTNANGDIARYKIFGSAGLDMTMTDCLAMDGDSHMLFGGRLQEQVSFGAVTLTPYPVSLGQPYTGCIVYVDTSGTVGWARKINLPNFRIFYADDVFHVLTTVNHVSPAIKVDETVVLDSTGLPGLVDLMFDKTGKVLGAKTIYSRRIGQSISSFTVNRFSDKKLLIGINCLGDSSLFVNKNPVVLPNILGNYYVLLKTDTSFNNVKARVLNPQRHPLVGYNVFPLPVTVSSNDSIYTVLTYESFTPAYNIDGFFQLPQRNMLYVFDSSLVARRQVQLGNTFAGSYPANNLRRRIFFRNILYKNGELFFNGQFTGINESPMNVIPKKDTTVTILPGINITVDQNGPSRSFVAKTDLPVLNSTFQWYGDHQEYENMLVMPAFFHNAGTNRIAFIQMQDNVWNPWLLNDSLKILSGAMRKSTDMPEVTQMIKYFDDGSRVVIGYARGKTALDSTENFITNGGRRDVFLVRLRSNNQVAWYKRLHSTLSNADIRDMEIKDGKAWFLVNYMNPQNDSNFIKVGTGVYDVKLQASLFANIDTAGNINVLNLTEPTIKYASLLHFGFFSNGDVALMTNSANIPYKSFPTNFGINLFRLRSTTGQLLEGRKLYNSFGANNMVIDKNDQLYISGPTFNSSPFTIFMHDGTMVIDSLRLTSYSAPQMSLLKLAWNGFKWQKRSSVGSSLRAELFLINNKPVVQLGAAFNTGISWEGQSIHNGYPYPTLSVVMLDTNGNITRNKVLPGFLYNFGRNGDKGQLYLSGGITQPVKLDTIQLNHSGNNDGLGLVLDSNLKVQRSFRIASPFSEVLCDMDIREDSLIALAYTAQTNPQVYNNRMMIDAGDYEEDAYVGTITSRTNIVTAINNPLPLFNDLTVSPNPISGSNLTISANVTQSLNSICRIYQNNGQFVSTKTMYLTPGTKQYTVLLPSSISKGVYYVVISNKKWTTTRSFIIQ